MYRSKRTSGPKGSHGTLRVSREIVRGGSKSLSSSGGRTTDETRPSSPPRVGTVRFREDSLATVVSFREGGVVQERLR